MPASAPEMQRWERSSSASATRYFVLPRELGKLRTDVVEMRQKMHDGHPNKTELFDIKHDSGGMVDIEFMVQFLVLAYAAQHPQLTANSGNLALMEQAAKLGLIETGLSDSGAQRVSPITRIQHQMRLNNQLPHAASNRAARHQTGAGTVEKAAYWNELSGGAAPDAGGS